MMWVLNRGRSKAKEVSVNSGKGVKALLPQSNTRKNATAHEETQREVVYVREEKEAQEGGTERANAH